MGKHRPKKSAPKLKVYTKKGRQFYRSPESIARSKMLSRIAFHFHYEMDDDARGVWYHKLVSKEKSARVKANRGQGPARQPHPPFLLRGAYTAAQMLAYGFDSTLPRDKSDKQLSKPHMPLLGAVSYDERRGELVMPIEVEFPESYRALFLPDRKGFKCPRDESAPWRLIGKARVVLTLRSPGLYSTVNHCKAAQVEFPIDYGMCVFNQRNRVEARASSVKVWRGEKGRYEWIEFKKLPVAYVFLQAEVAVDVHEHYELLVSGPGPIKKLAFRNPGASPYKPTWV